MSSSKSSYIYRSIREGDQVRRTYVGTLGDPAVQTLLDSVRLRKATVEAEQRKTEHELEIVETMDTCLQLIQSSANRAVRNLRKRWRRGNQTRIRRLSMPKSNPRHDKYEALVADAADGDMGALADLKHLLKENPQLREVLGDLNHHVQTFLVGLASGGALDIRVSLLHSLAAKREELIGEGDSLPEQMLVDLILSSMLDAAVCQIGFQQSHAKEKIKRRWELRLERAQQRHQAAIVSLVEVRRMLQKETNKKEDLCTRHN